MNEKEGRADERAKIVDAPNQVGGQEQAKHETLGEDHDVRDDRKWREG